MSQSQSVCPVNTENLNQLSKAELVGIILAQENIINQLKREINQLQQKIEKLKQFRMGQSRTAQSSCG